MHIATGGEGLKNRAFTLIELLAVIVILAVITLIVSPIIMNVIGKTKKQAFERSIDGILDAVRIDYSSDDFVSPREYFYEGNNLTLLTVNDKTLDESVGIKGKINGKGFIYVDEDGVIHIENICSKDYCANGAEPNVEITENVTGTIPELSKNDPMIKIKGDKTVYVNIGDTYTELGATAKTKSGQVLEYTSEITLNGEIVTSIDTTNENTYVITYKTEHEEKIVTDTRNVVILDMKPVITITEGKETYVKEQEILITASAVRPNTITNFTVEIKKDGENIKTETVNGISKTVVLNETGNYEVIVTVTDNREHTSTITKTYKIDSEPPVIEFTGEVTLNANEASGFKFKEDNTVKVNDNSEVVTWEVEGNLNTEVGDQRVTYIAIDEAGNETRVERVFHIVSAEGPVVNYSSASSNGIWIGAQDITIYARIEIENDELTELKYQVDEEAEVFVPITNNKQMEKAVKLNTTGRHTIKITATGKHRNKTEVTIGEYLIDVTGPVVGNISGNTDIWTTSKTLTAALTDSNSGVKYYALIKDSATKPAVNSSDWKAVTVGSSYNFSQNITANGTYYLWAKDSAGNISTAKTVTVSKIDRDNPTAPTTMNFVYGDWSVYTNNTWTNQHVYAGRTKTSPAPTGATDTLSGVAKYQISTDNKTWEDFSYVNSGIYAMTTEGTHTRYFRAVDSAGNAGPSISRVAKIDKTGPTVGAIGGNNTTWEKNKTITSTITDTGSGVSHYALIKNSSTKPAVNSAEWKAVTVGSSYKFSQTVTSNGTYYLWAKDSAGNISSSAATVTINRIDDTIPTLTINGSYSGKYGTSKDLSTLYTPSYGGMGGSGVTCKNGTTAITNVNQIKLAGTYSIKCIATGKNGKSSAEKTITVTLTPKTFTEVMTSSVITDPWNNKRYVGASPNNYVSFNNGEKWRIIGLFGSNPKIIRSSSIGYMAWDTAGNNDWTTASLNIYLNKTYVIDATSKTYIQSYNWKLGASSNWSDINRQAMYNAERGSTIYTGNSSSSWTGSIGLMYASDYAYATSGGSTCNTTTLNKWHESPALEECAQKSWLRFGNAWTLTHITNAKTALFIGGLGDASNNATNESTWLNVVPALYLKSTIKIHGGTGTSGDPYILGT